MLSVLTQFLSNRSPFVLVDGCRSKLVNVVSGVPQGSVLGPLLFLLYTSEPFSILENNKLIGYDDDSTLMAVVPSSGARVTVAESLNRDLVRVNAWCDLLGIKLNATKTKTMIVSTSRTMHPQSPPLIIDGTVLKESVKVALGNRGMTVGAARQCAKDQKEWSFTRPFLLGTVFFGPPSRAMVVITWRGEGCRYMMRLG